MKTKLPFTHIRDLFLSIFTGLRKVGESSISMPPIDVMLTEQEKELYAGKPVTAVIFTLPAAYAPWQWVEFCLMSEKVALRRLSPYVMSLLGNHEHIDPIGSICFAYQEVDLIGITNVATIDNDTFQSLYNNVDTAMTSGDTYDTYMPLLLETHNGMRHVYIPTLHSEMYDLPVCVTSFVYEVPMFISGHPIRNIMLQKNLLGRVTDFNIHYVHIVTRHSVDHKSSIMMAAYTKRGKMLGVVHVDDHKPHFSNVDDWKKDPVKTKVHRYASWKDITRMDVKADISILHANTVCDVSVPEAEIGKQIKTGKLYFTHGKVTKRTGYYD